MELVASGAIEIDSSSGSDSSYSSDSSDSDSSQHLVETPSIAFEEGKQGLVSACEDWYPPQLLVGSQDPSMQCCNEFQFQDCEQNVSRKVPKMHEVFSKGTQ